MAKPRCITCGNAYPCACPSIDELIERSSLGAAMRDIKERGIEAHLRDLENETEKPWKRK